LLAGLVIGLRLQDDSGERAVAFGDRVPGQRIYDQTGLLSEGQLAAIDRRAESIERSGVPVVVYIRDPAADAPDAQRAARQLMQLWNVESAPGAADGLVLLLDVERGEDSAGAVAVVAGDRLGASRLPARETERIAVETLTHPLPVTGLTEKLVTGIGAGLATTERRLLLGAPAAPAPSLLERQVTAFVRVPLASLSVLLGLAALVSAGMLWWHRPRAVSDEPTGMDLSGPIPAPLRAALAANRVDGEVVAVAIRDLVRSGAVAYDDLDDDDWDGAPRGSLRLLDHRRVSGPIAHATWADLAAVADPRGRVTPAGVMGVSRAPRRLSPAIATELERHGWWDATAPRRAAPLRLLGRVLAGVGAAGLVLGLAVEEPVALWSVGLLATGAVVAWACARAYPRATPRGLAIVRGQDGEAAAASPG
jgi:uncharacterized membrane protein YgcG